MVKTSLTFLIFLSALLQAETYTFKMESTKAKLFQGEDLTVNYTLSGNSDTLDVEVVKFPEFKGFWTENKTLRQGPLALSFQGMDFFSNFQGNQDLKRLLPALPTIRMKGKRQALVGSYLLTAMVGAPELRIAPMKIVVKDPLHPSVGQVIMESEQPSIEFIPLPAVPPALAPHFKGAVGRFSLSTEGTELQYQSGEPTRLRIFITGSGNFSEINSLGLEATSAIEILSKTTEIQGSSDVKSKLFEYVLLVKGDKTQTLPSVSFVYFDPYLKKYQQLETGTWTLIPRPEKEITAKEPIEIPLLEPGTGDGSLIESKPFWAIQLLLLFIIASDLFFYFAKMSLEKRKISTRFHLKQMQASVLQAMKNGDHAEAFHTTQRLIDTFTHTLRPGLRPGDWNSQLVVLSQVLGEKSLRELEEYITSHQLYLYGPKSETLQPPEIQIKNVRPILAKLAK